MKSIGVIGLGYVGLPLALTFHEHSEKEVIGFDIDKSKTDKITLGKSYLKTVSDERLTAATCWNDTQQKIIMMATTNMERLTVCDTIIICVPTPLDAHRQPDLSYVDATSHTIAKYLQKGTLVVLESSTYPGTTRERILPILETSGLKAGVDFHLAFSPEREDPGNPEYHTGNITKVVGGLTPECTRRAVALYESVIDTVHPVSSPEVAEMTKLLENIFRSVNIAMINELKMACIEMDIDLWEAIEAAKTKPFGFMPFYPGPGLGGHCIPIDPFYFTWKAKEFGLTTRFIELAGEINTQMPHYVVGRLVSALNEHEKSLKGSKVLILGVAYKPDIDDMRESPGLEIIKILSDAGALVSYNDPFIPELWETRRHKSNRRSASLEFIEQYDAVVIVTNHSQYDWEDISSRSQLVIDTRGVTRDNFTA